jgi:hypothetical protein
MLERYNVSKNFQRCDYDRAWQELHDATLENGRDYLVYHRDRHWETFCTLASCLKDFEEPKVLEVGVSPFVQLYRKLFPSVILTTLDRPTDVFGVSPETAINEWGASRHYSLNLNTTALTPSLGDPPIGLYDYIVFCEVLEHVPVSAEQLLRELLSVLEAEGLMYVTTPNFFAYDRLGKILNRENPQEHFRQREADKWASTHFREYSMSELFSIVSDAGGKVIRARYSDCWMDDAARSLVSGMPALQSNLVIVVCHRNSRRMPDHTVASVKATFGPLTKYEWEAIRLRSSR